MPGDSLSAAGMRVMKLLVGTPPQTISGLTRAAGVTRTAVAEQLNEMLAAGLVERSTERLAGRGRPRHLYRATPAALALLVAGNQRLVAPAVWQAIRDVGGEELLRKVLKRVSRTLAGYYNEKITAKRAPERLRQFIGLLTAEGGLVDAVDDGDGRWVLRKRSCPFISMVDPERSVCFIDREMLSAVVGRPVRQTMCRHEGDPCCAFEISGP
jgi:predicted ArsR family transcriptional regulator